MAKSTAKLKIAAAEVEFVSPLRAPLAAALARVDEIRAAIAANTAEQEAAAAKIRELEATLEDSEKRLAQVPALERRAVRKEIDEAKEVVSDWRDHAAELQKKANDSFSGLRSKLQDAENEVHRQRAALVKGHPHKIALHAELNELRARTAQVTSDLSALAAIGGIEEGWASSSATNPPASAALVAWINEVMVNPNAEISDNV